MLRCTMSFHLDHKHTFVENWNSMLPHRAYGNSLHYITLLASWHNLCFHASNISICKHLFAETRCNCLHLGVLSCPSLFRFLATSHIYGHTHLSLLLHQKTLPCGTWYASHGSSKGWKWLNMISNECLVWERKYVFSRRTTCTMQCWAASSEAIWIWISL